MRNGIVGLLIVVSAVAFGQTFDAGTHRVWNDVHPGVYRSPEDVWCNWMRLGGELGNERLAFGISNHATVEIEATDSEFRTNCGPWTAIRLSQARRPVETLDPDTLANAAVLLMDAFGELLRRGSRESNHPSFKRFIRKHVAEAISNNARMGDEYQEAANILIEYFESSLEGQKLWHTDR